MIRLLAFAITVFLISCASNEGDNWKETENGILVYDMCFFEHIGISQNEKKSSQSLQQIRSKLNKISYLNCDGLSLSIPKDNWNEDTKLLSDQGATVFIPRQELELETVAHPKDKVRLSVTPIRYWERSHDAQRALINQYFNLHDLEPKRSTSNGFIILSAPSLKSPVFYTPPINESDIFIHCNALDPWPDLHPDDGTCLVYSNVNGLVHVRYNVLRKDISNIRETNKKIASYIGAFYRERS